MKTSDRGFVGDDQGNGYGRLEEGTLAEKQPPKVFSSVVILGMVATVLASNSGMAIPKMIEQAEYEGKWKPLCGVVCMHLIAVAMSVRSFIQLRPAWKSVAGNPPADEGSKDYDPRWDNLKFVLTQFVAQAHFIQWRWHDVVPVQVLRCAQEWFLMQTYVFMSGYLAIPVHTNARLQSLWKSVVFCYVINQLLYIIFLRGPLILLNVATPWGPMWYLLSLIIWRLLAPMWVQLSYPLSIAVVIATFLGYSPLPRIFAVGWTFAFLPWYVVGIYARRQQHAFKAALQWPGVYTGGILAFCTMFICVVVNGMQYCGGSTRCLYLDTSMNPKEVFAAPFYTAHELQWMMPFLWMVRGKGFWLLWYGRLASFPAHCVMIFSAIALLASTENISLNLGCCSFELTKRGSRSLLNYVLHHWAVFLLAGFYAHDGEFSFLRLMVALLLACIVANILMWEPVYKFFRPILLSPDISWLMVPIDKK